MRKVRCNGAAIALFQGVRSGSDCSYSESLAACVFIVGDGARVISRVCVYIYVCVSRIDSGLWVLRLREIENLSFEKRKRGEGYAQVGLYVYIYTMICSGNKRN